MSYEEGSPPRAWGKRALGIVGAGVLTVHPHVRGENAQFPYRALSTTGSPPRAWGKP